MIFITANIVIACCVALLAGTIANNFAHSNTNKSIHSQKSLVATGTMAGFGLMYFILIRFRIGAIELPPAFTVACIIIGVVIVLAGSAINLSGRLHLGQNWGNHIHIYNNHTLVQTGAYKIVRHPLYFALICLFTGSALVHSNAAALTVTHIIFTPFMYYRARQEEVALMQQFSTDYTSYQKRTGMLFPRFYQEKSND
ncbi:MAG: isoprenylcysteine carboxylmethyltransferase family protein [Ignavibacteria bacterium]|nr:isoprenylcysteine carboxylmethyltransferase family protein [Ignavibacteria bacterium]